MTQSKSQTLVVASFQVCCLQEKPGNEVTLVNLMGIKQASVITMNCVKNPFSLAQ